MLVYNQILLSIYLIIAVIVVMVPLHFFLNRKKTTSSNLTIKKRILCVEDELSMGKRFKELLEKEGYEVDNAYDGEEGLKMILTDKYDLITLDHLMPKMCGDVVLERLKGVKLKAKVGMLTNLSDDEHIKHALNHGARFYMVTTNYSPGTFVEEINHLINSEGSFTGPDEPEEANQTIKDEDSEKLFSNSARRETSTSDKPMVTEKVKFYGLLLLLAVWFFFPIVLVSILDIEGDWNNVVTVFLWYFVSMGAFIGIRTTLSPSLMAEMPFKSGLEALGALVVFSAGATYLFLLMGS